MIREVDEDDLERGSDAVDSSVYVPDNDGETWTPKISQTLTDSTSDLESSSEYNEAQFALTCAVCGQSCSSAQFCNPCSLYICGQCVAQHLKTPGKHNVVDFRERTVGVPRCIQHQSIDSTYQCITCNVCICNDCMMTMHRLHRNVHIKEVMDRQSNILMKNMAELQSVIKPVFQQKTDYLKLKLANAKKGYDVIDSDISMCAEKLRRDVDLAIGALKLEAEKYRKEHTKELEHDISVLETKLIEVQEASKKGENALSKPLELLKYESNIESLKTIPEMTDFDLPVYSPGRVDVKAGVGQLSHLVKSVIPSSVIKKRSAKKSKKIKQEPTIETSITVGERYVYDVACASKSSVWMCGAGLFYYDNNVRLIEKDGNNKETLECPINPKYIALKSPGCVLFSDDSDKTVKLWSRDYQRVFIKTDSWIPEGLAVTLSGDVIVCQYRKTEVAAEHNSLSRVVRYNGEGSEIRKIEYNKEKRMFWHALFVAENRNFDVCVSDKAKHAVVVLDKMGEFQFIYKGNIKTGKFQSFNPRGLDTDSQGNILISDYMNYTVHIIDQYGNFLHYLMRKHLKFPLGISVDADDKVWVGEYNNGTIAVIEYLS